jgi:hypothetical protein
MKKIDAVLSVLFILSMAAACHKKATNANIWTGTFVIHNLGVVFGPWNKSTNRAGDFLFRAGEYRIVKSALVTAVAEGEITRFEYQSDTQDYEIGTRSTIDPDWEIGYDHVVDPRVANGGRVSPGTFLGNPGTWNADLGRFEIMINNTATGLSYCPFCMFDPEYENLLI